MADKKVSEDLKKYMDAPMWFLWFDDKADQHININEDAVKILKTIKKKLVVVGIAGPFRKGKSYLMNRLGGIESGFPVGNTVQAATKGIWIWIRPHPIYKDKILVLLDTEGLNDSEKGDQTHDVIVFTLCVLLCSHLVYNSSGNIDQDALEKLRIVADMTEHIKMKANPDEEEDGTEFDSQFPRFTWVVRDLTLSLKMDGDDITPDEYLENCLKLKKGINKQIKEYNFLRESIRSFFKLRKCFVFPVPTDPKRTKELDQLADEDLDEVFLEELQVFCQFVWRQSPAKTFDIGIPVDGKMYVNLVESYVKAINKNGIPCMESAAEYISKQKNDEVLKHCLDLYKEKMEKEIKCDPVTSEDLGMYHKEYSSEVYKIFVKEIIFKKVLDYQPLLEIGFGERFIKIVEENDANSEKKCKGIIEDSSKELNEKLKSGYYLRPGGYKDFAKDIKRITKKFWNVPKKGDQAQKVISEFAIAMNRETEKLMRIDEKLTEEQINLEIERNKANEAAEAAKIQEEENKLLLERHQLAVQSHQEHVTQLQRQQEEEIRNTKEYLNDQVNMKIAEIELCNKQNLKRQAKELEEEIDALKDKLRSTSSFWKPFVEAVTQVAHAVPGILMASRLASIPKK